MANLDEQIRIGSEAEFILNSTAFKAAMEELEAQIIFAWANGSYELPGQREEAFYRVSAAKNFREKLTSFLDRKRVAKSQIDAAEKRAAVRNGQANA